MVTKMKGYVPQGERKKILLMCDDIRTHSGIGTIAKETLYYIQLTSIIGFNVGAAIQHPEAGKHLDISADINKETGLYRRCICEAISK